MACIVAFALPAAAKELQAGAATVELHPPIGMLMGGYGARVGVSSGVLDPLHAKVLVLEGKDRAVALVTMDLVGVLPTAQLDEIRARVKAATGIEDVIFNASHTHSGPYLMDTVPEWETRATTDIAAGIERAWQSRHAAHIGTGRGSVLIGHNRLYFMTEGRGKMLWRNETRIPTSPVDPTVMILRVDGEDGKPIAVLVNYACHAVVLGPENLQYSADWPGEMARTVEAAYPGAVCLFLQGGAGNINPYYDKTPLIENAVGLMRETGRTVGNEVLRVMPSIQTHSLPDASLQVARDNLRFPGRWNRQKVLSGVSLPQLSFDSRDRIERATAPWYDGPVTTLLLGREFAFVGVPAEIFVDFQVDIRARVRDFPIFFGGYTNGNLGYVPTIKAAVDGGYGASQLGSFIEVGAGNRMIDTAVIRLGYWTGKLQDRPAPAQ
jgi:hypothetical protein